MKLETSANLNVTKQDIEDLKFALTIVRLNQNTHGDDLENKQSVRAYKLLDALFYDLGI
jgi:hypothetical protein